MKTGPTKAQVKELLEKLDGVPLECPDLEGISKLPEASACNFLIEFAYEGTLRDDSREGKLLVEMSYEILQVKAVKLGLV